MAQIITIQDREGDTCYPITSTKAVIGENGVDLDTRVDQLQQKLAKKQDTFSTSEDMQLTDGRLSLTDEFKASKLDASVWNGANKQFSVVGEYILAADGKNPKAANYSRTPLLPLNRNYDVVCRAATDSTVAAVAFYDAAGGYIKGYRYWDGTTKVPAAEIPTNAVYVAFSGINNSTIKLSYQMNGSTFEDTQAVTAAAIKSSKGQWLIDLFNADPNGCYKPDKDLFELNKLELTWEEAYNVALWGNKLFDLAFTGSVDNNYRLAPIRTNLTPINSYTGLSLKWSKAFYFQREIEVIRLAAEDDQWNAFSTSDSWPVNAFNSCRKLREIIGKIDWSNATNVNANNFAACYELREIRFYKLKHNISFVDCALLSLASFRYMIDNAINTAAITITVHPDVFAKLTDETNTEWHAVYTAAAEKNISFITP